MAIDSYAALQAFVVAHLELDATTEAQLPNLIQMAEARLNRLLLAPEREVVAYTSTVAGAQTLALPADYRQMRSILVNDDYPLAHVTLNVLLGNWAEMSGEPQVFTVANQSLYFGPTPDAEYTVTITYLASLEALSASNTSNWLLASHPDAYVYATMFEVEAFLTNDERLPNIRAHLDSVIADINKAGNRYRSSGPTRLRSPVVV